MKRELRDALDVLMDIFNDEDLTIQEAKEMALCEMVHVEKIIDSIEDAVNHINKYGSSHKESIITSTYSSRNSKLFI